MPMPATHTDVTAQMKQWREGELSDSEIIAILIEAMIEVWQHIRDKENAND